MLDDTFKWIRFPNEKEELFDDRVPYDEVVKILSDGVTRNTVLLEKLEELKAKRA